MKFRVLDDHGDASLVSPPSRGAWIEMLCHAAQQYVAEVAPLAGGVDCNNNCPRLALTSLRRPPRGGRGLKSSSTLLTMFEDASPPSRGAWIEMSAEC